MFADLYSKGLVCASLFGATLNYVLKRATTPELYTILFRCLLMRALTETAPKIPVDRWKVIRECWFETERNFDTSAYKLVNDVLFVFGEDAQVNERMWCGLPICEEVEYGELEEFCESLVWDDGFEFSSHAKEWRLKSPTSAQAGGRLGVLCSQARASPAWLL